MGIKLGAHVVLTLSDGSVLRGTRRWSWPWQPLRLVDVEAFMSTGPTPVQGVVLAPRAHIVMVQVLA